MRWFGLDFAPGNVRRTDRILLCRQEEAAEDGLRNKRLVEERLNWPALKKAGASEKNADYALRGAGRD